MITFAITLWILGMVPVYECTKDLFPEATKDKKHRIGICLITWPLITAAYTLNRAIQAIGEALS